MNERASGIVVSLLEVFRRPKYAASSLLLFPAAVIFYAWAAQILIAGRHGVAILYEPDVMATIVVLSVLFAISLPLQFYAIRHAMATSGPAGSSFVGVVLGTASMSCCAPVVLPALLSLIGFSGTAILSVNLAIHKYFIPLALLAAVQLLHSVISTALSISAPCDLAAASGEGASSRLPQTKP